MVPQTTGQAVTKKVSTLETQKNSAYQGINGQTNTGGRNLKTAQAAMRDQVTMDKRAYEDIMSYLIKMECKRLEKDKSVGSQSGKRPQSGLNNLNRSKETGNVSVTRKAGMIGSRLKVTKTPTKQPIKTPQAAP